MDRRTIILGRVKSGGTDPATLRPLPDVLTDINAISGDFESLGLQTQLIADVALKIYREKALIRASFFKRHTHAYSFNEIGEKTLYRIVTTQNYVAGGIRDASKVFLILSEDNSQNIINAFESALSG